LTIGANSQIDATSRDAVGCLSDRLRTRTYTAHHAFQVVSHPAKRGKELTHFIASYAMDHPTQIAGGNLRDMRQRNFAPDLIIDRPAPAQTVASLHWPLESRSLGQR
jgi:hypothetical protein